MEPTLKHYLREVFTFGVIGVFATITHYFLTLICYEVLSVNIYVANLVGFLCALTASCIGHAKLTFRVKLNRAIIKRFIIATVFIFTSSQIILALLEETTKTSHRISIAIIVIFIPVTSYFLNKFWVYKAK